MSFDSERNKWKEPSLAELTEKAIGILERDKNGFFLFVEGWFPSPVYYGQLRIKVLEIIINDSMKDNVFISFDFMFYIFGLTNNTYYFFN